MRLRRGIEEQLRPVASDHHDRAEPRLGLVVQVERAQPLADGVAALVVVELDLDAELVVHADDATSAPAATSRLLPWDGSLGRQQRT